jgi:hypothetical protein
VTLEETVERVDVTGQPPTDRVSRIANGERPCRAKRAVEDPASALGVAAREIGEPTAEAPRVETDSAGRIDRVWLSAHSGQGIDLLLDALHRQLGADLYHCLMRLPPREGRARARLFAAGAVLRQRPLDDGGIELEVSLRRHELERICREAGLELPVESAPCAGPDPFLQSPGRVAAGAPG